MNIDTNKTVYMQPNADSGSTLPAKKTGGKIIMIVGILFMVIIAASALYYFLVYNADPKIKIEYTVSGNIEQKNNNNYEQLYKSASSIKISVILSKPSKKTYELEVNGIKNKLDFTEDGTFYTAYYTANPNQRQNSYYTVNLITGDAKPLFTDNFNVVIIKPNISSKEYIENYLKTYSSAVSNKSSSDLLNASNYWVQEMSSGIYDKMRKGFSDLTSYWYDNVISTPDDDVSAKVYYTIMKNNKWTSFTLGYFYELTVIKNSSGLPQWKILKAKETMEKKDTFGGDFEGE